MPRQAHPACQAPPCAAHRLKRTSLCHKDHTVLQCLRKAQPRQGPPTRPRTPPPPPEPPDVPAQLSPTLPPPASKGHPMAPTPRPEAVRREADACFCCVVFGCDCGLVDDFIHHTFTIQWAILLLSTVALLTFARPQCCCLRSYIYL